MIARPRHSFTAFLVLACLALTSYAGAARAAQPRQHTTARGTLTVFAAASLHAAFTTIGAAFSKANKATVRFNFNASDQLETQLAEGAPADVFAPADQAHMQLAVSHGLIAGKPTVFTHNKLVVILPRGNPAHIHSLRDLARPGVALVLAAPTVPVGKYARAAFAAMAADRAFGPHFLAGIQKNIKSDEINDTAVVAKVALGEADAGVVYVSDLATKQAAQITSLAIPARFNQIATYPMAVTRDSRHAALAQQFERYVLSPAGQATLKASGFLVGGFSAGVP